MLAASVQAVLEEVLIDLCGWLYSRTGNSRLALAGGVALNCVANTRLLAESPFSEIWVQPASGDSGTALGAALTVAAEAGDDLTPMMTAALGRTCSRKARVETCAAPWCETFSTFAEKYSRSMVKKTASRPNAITRFHFHIVSSTTVIRTPSMSIAPVTAIPYAEARLDDVPKVMTRMITITISAQLMTGI